ncbi:MAG: hypothetical protein JSV23_08855 [Promethearchaeota archaeon]|nr:MAG: hypothetical protein JSV23_08855 [Candidatus Lokiarchaeota archaeon]
MEETENQKQERVQKLKEEILTDYKGNQLLKQKYELKIKNSKLLGLLKRSELNPRYVEEYEQLLSHEEYLRDYYRQPHLILEDEKIKVVNNDIEKE